MLRRAKARYELGLYKDALSDISKVNASSEKTDDSVSFENTVKAAVTGNKSGANAQVAAAKGNAKPPPSKEQTANMLRQSNNQFVCKVTMDSETKILHLPYGISYHTLQLAIKEKWTGLHNFKIFYQDREQDWVLVTCARDVAKAQQDIIAYAQRVLSQRQRQGLDSQVGHCQHSVCHTGTRLTLDCPSTAVQPVHSPLWPLSHTAPHQLMRECLTGGQPPHTSIIAHAAAAPSAPHRML